MFDQIVDHINNVRLFIETALQDDRKIIQNADNVKSL